MAYPIGHRASTTAIQATNTQVSGGVLSLIMSETKGDGIRFELPWRRIHFTKPIGLDDIQVLAQGRVSFDETRQQHVCM